MTPLGLPDDPPDDDAYHEAIAEMQQAQSPGPPEAVHQHPEATRAQQVALGLRELADWLDEHPDAPAVSANVGAHLSKAGGDVSERFAAAVAMLGGGVRFESRGEYFVARKAFGPGIEYAVQCYRHDTAEVPAITWPAAVVAVAPQLASHGSAEPIPSSPEIDEG